MCREHLPEPPQTHRVRCELDHKSRTQELYPEWPEDFHGWHAAMQCIPEWQPYKGDQDASYRACLTDVYAQVKQNNSKAVGIPVAIWRCKDQMPEPPSEYSPRCLLDEVRDDEAEDRLKPEELAAWKAIVTCQPAYQP